MCKTCGCAADTQQLWLQFKEPDRSPGLQALRDGLLSAPGVLQATLEAIDAESSQLVLDFNPQHTTQHELEQLVAAAGYTPQAVELRQLEHKHGISSFIKRIFRQ